LKALVNASLAQNAQDLLNSNWRMEQDKSPLRFQFRLTEKEEGVFKDATIFPESVLIDDDAFNMLMKKNKFVNRSLKF
jgi:hypothetical protein